MAQTPAFSLPVNCTIDEDCWVVNYVDTDPSETARDFACGTRTYNAHHGTDFGIPDLLTMEMGVDVLAAADGTILRLRDGVEDKIVTPEERAELLENNRGCGNGVYIDHGAGWQTIYCHMKEGSLAVKEGQEIKAGDKIGQVGASGIAEFPHLHFGVFFEGQTVDPYTGIHTDENGAHCGTPVSKHNEMWQEGLGLEYEPLIIYATGFKAGVPDYEAIKIDITAPESVPAGSEALTFWSAFYGAAAGDKVVMEVTDPLGRVFARREMTQEKDRARQFYFIGRKVDEDGLRSGLYKARVKLTRTAPDGETITRQVEDELRVK